MTVPKRYRKLPVEITAMELRQYGDFVRANDWINANGGRSVFAKGSGQNPDYLILSTLEGNMEAHLGVFVIQGVKGEFYPCDPEVFKLSHEAVEEPQTAPETAGGLYVTRGAPEAYSPSGGLVGGAALEMPRG